MGRKKMSSLFLKFGITVGCIAGCTSFINKDGNKVGVGVCCWFFGKLPDAQANLINFGVYGDAVDPDTFLDDNEDEEEDTEDFGLNKLFASAL